MTDPRGILRQYIELCSSEINRLDDQLASNAILEWKGVTVRGRSRIVKFLRYKQQAGLVQRFTNANTVAAFEERETHMSTMITPPENLTVQSTTLAEPTTSLPENKSSDKSASPDMNLSFETPPRLHPISSEPPPLTAGRQFLPLSSSSDDEEDEPDPNRDSPMPSLVQPHQNVYSELQYLEAIGTVRSCNESKHRGTRTTHHIPREDSSPTADGTSTPIPSTPGSSAPSDKRTKLKLSYRKHVHTQEHQFALIIYEDLTPRSSKVRRNLFCDEQPQVGTEEPPDAPEPPSPIRLQPANASPEARPLPETPPPVPSPPPAEVTPPHTPLEPPGTPHRQRRIPPAGMRTSPRRSRAIMNFTIAADDSPTSSSNSNNNNNNNNNNNTLQTWPRKNHPTGGSPGGSAAKNRKLATGSSTVRKPLRF
ncbi:uncharacterized protein LOC135700749 [Ochlerotatus camptorhynchus]|uniref:uncharacterized protein LOC135700749 n=1 Tax=Ochlerotatus camptorhynchus TaxID=644619 RepID=UPI0031CE7E13